MPNDGSFVVRCTKEVPGKDYIVSPPETPPEKVCTYTATPGNRGGSSPHFWVGIKGQWGDFFTPQEFTEHFQKTS